MIVSADSRCHVRFETKFFSDGVKVWLPLRVLQAAKHELIVSVGRGRHVERERQMFGFDVGEWVVRFWGMGGEILGIFSICGRECGIG